MSCYSWDYCTGTGRGRDFCEKKGGDLGAREDLNVLGTYSGKEQKREVEKEELPGRRAVNWAFSGGEKGKGRKSCRAV